MTTAGPGTGFSLSYELQRRDLAEMQAASKARRIRRAHQIAALVALALFGAAFTAITAAFDRPSLVKGSPGAPGWVYAVDAVTWCLVILAASRAWRLSPKGRARAIWRTAPQLQGHHHDVVDNHGITSTAPDGTQVFIPWAGFARVRETEHGFHLLDDTGDVRGSLPKRGLDSPDLIPALRDMLNRSVGGQPPAER